MEKILRIEETSNSIGQRGWCGTEGYAIITDKQTIKLLIDSGQSCCEHYGYFMSEDKFDSFEGATLLDITITDTCLNTQKLNDEHVGDGKGNLYAGGIMFVNIHTDKGVLQFVAYNEHNGYYGHTAYVISEQLKHEENL
jgi:hypothetical protein